MILRLTHLVFCIGLLSPSVFASSFGQNPGLEADQLLSYFSAGCQSQGEATRTALQYSTGLVETLKSLAEDPDCKSLNGALGNIHNLSEALNSLNRNANEARLNQLTKQEQQYVQFISQTNDQSSILTLSSSLREIQSEIILMKPYVDQDLSRPYQAFVTNSRIILDQASRSPLCIRKHSEVLTGLAGIVGAVGAVTLSGGSSLLVGGGIDLMNLMIETGRIRKLNKSIAENLSPKRSTAFMCTLETLSNQYCDSRSSLEILHLVANAQMVSTPFQRAANLLLHDTPLFLNWLNTVPAGAEPTNIAISGRQADLNERDKDVRNAKQTGPGVINQYQPTFDAIPSTNENDRWTVEQQIIKEIKNQFKIGSSSSSPFGGPSGPPSPLADVLGSNAGTISEWLLIGVSADKIPLDGLSIPRSLSTVSTVSQLRELKDSHGLPVVPSDFKPDLVSLKKNMVAWIKRGEDRVASERLNILNQDTLLMISKSATLQGDNLSSPYRSLLSLIQFTDEQTVIEGTTGSFGTLFKDTHDKLLTIACEIHQVVGDSASRLQAFSNRESFQALENAAILKCPTQTLTPNPDDIIKAIYAAGKLDNGTGFLKSRLEWALRKALTQLNYTDASGVSSQQSAILLAQSDYISDLQNYSSKEHQRIQDDILSAQSITKQNLTGFTHAFSPMIGQVLANYREKGEMGQVARLCTLLLAVPQWPTNIPQSLCEGASYASVHDGQDALAILPMNFSQPFEERVCKYYNFEQKNKLYQELVKIKSGNAGLGERRSP